MANKILALDQSTRVSGWAFFNNNKLIAFGHWEHTEFDVARRIHSLCQQIEEKIDLYKPDIVLIENIQYEEKHGGIDTFQKLAWVQGALLRMCIEKNIPYKLIYPAEWRKLCNFLKGQAKDRTSQKKIAQAWVQTTWNMKCTQDEADAICIAYSETVQNQKVFDWTD